MRRTLSCYIVLCLSSVLVSGCATTGQNLGKSFMKKGQYDLAIDAFTLEINVNPDNASAWRGLGVAYYKSGNDERAIKSLQTALVLDPNDGNSIFYMGAVYERKEEYDSAIEFYRRYTQVGRLSKTRGKIEGRLEWLVRKKMQSDAQKALEEESSLDVESIPDNTIAVLYFENIGENRQLDPLQKGLADMLITDLSKVGELKVVERIRMQKLFEEMKLGMSGLVDQSTAPRVGKLLGASRLVRGTILDLDETKMRIDAGLIETKSGKFAVSKEVSGDLENFFRLEKDLVFNIIDQMGITLTKEEEESILIIPTKSMLALLAYSNGLGLEDEGKYSEAISQYAQALSIDPGFALAGGKMKAAEQAEGGSGDISEIEEGIEEQAPEDDGKLERLTASGEKINAGFMPGPESREPLQEEAGKGIGGVQIGITIIIPPVPE